MRPWEERAHLLREASRHFHQYFADLPSEAWDRQSACDQWFIKDVVAHLVGNAAFYATTVERGLHNVYDPLPGRPPTGEGHPSVGAGATAAGAIANRERLGDRLLDTLVAHTDRLVQLLPGLSPRERHKPCYHPGGLVPAENFVDLRFKELGLPQWDIRSVLEPGAAVVPESWSSMLILIQESLASGALRWAFWGGPALSQPVRYRFETPAPIAFRADIVVEGDSFRLETPSDSPAAVAFHGDAGTLALMMSGRLAVSDAVSQHQGHAVFECNSAESQRLCWLGRQPAAGRRDMRMARPSQQPNGGVAECCHDLGDTTTTPLRPIPIKGPITDPGHGLCQLLHRRAGHFRAAAEQNTGAHRHGRSPGCLAVLRGNAHRHPESAGQSRANTPSHQWRRSPHVKPAGFIMRESPSLHCFALRWPSGQGPDVPPWPTRSPDGAPVRRHQDSGVPACRRWQ